MKTKTAQEILDETLDLFLDDLITNTQKLIIFEDNEEFEECIKIRNYLNETIADIVEIFIKIGDITDAKEIEEYLRSSMKFMYEQLKITKNELDN